MNLAIAGMAFFLSAVFGFKAYLIIQLILLLVAGSAGVWLFYVQHQFEDVYWERRDEWDYAAAALQGSSFYKLPRVFQWFSGNIGFHHIHHLSPRIPNYNLERCHNASPCFQQVKPITLFSSFKCLSFRLWDEQRRKLVGYRRLKELRRPESVKNSAITSSSTNLTSTREIYEPAVLSFPWAYCFPSRKTFSIVLRTHSSSLGNFA